MDCFQILSERINNLRAHSYSGDRVYYILVVATRLPKTKTANFDSCMLG